MDSQPRLSRQLTRNTAFNLAGQVWVALLLLVCAPALVHRLGDHLFGIVSLAWALLGSVTVFDFGFSQASTKFVAEHLARNDRMGAARVLWTALPINVALGLPCAVGLAAAAPALATRVFHVPAGAQQDVIAALVLVAIALPFVLVQGMLRGVPSALQRFDLINTISMAAATVQWTSAVAFAYLGGGVRSVIAATVVVRIAGTLVYGVLAVRLLPETAARGAWSLSGVRRLASFSSWIAVSQLLTPVLMYADRLFIASLRSVAALTYYTVPSDAVARLGMFPGSLTPTLYPAFTDQSVAGRRGTVAEMYVRSVRYIFLAVGPIALLLVLYAKDVLSLWMGPAFADQSAVVLQVLALGTLANCLAWVPDVAIKGLGRPDLVAKLQMAEAPVYLALAWWLIGGHGIYGAAAAWTMRLAADAAGLFILGNRLVGLSLRQLLAERLLLSSGGTFILLTVFLWSVRHLEVTIPARLAIVAAGLVGYALLTWSRGLDRTERGAITDLRRAVVAAARYGVRS